jgi:enoyl-CoA hydratase/carnithine racemase
MARREERSVALIQYAVHNDVAIMTLDTPPENFLTEDMLDALDGVVRRFQQDASAAVAVLRGAGRNFSLGANPAELGVLYNSDAALPLVALIEATDKPMIALLHGQAYGGALEIALACHLRFAGPDVAMAFPEVREGFSPGAGATQRLPRLMGIPAALTMLTDGVVLDGPSALKAGLVDLVLSTLDLAVVCESAKEQVLRWRGVMTKTSLLPWPDDDIDTVLASHRIAGHEMRDGEAFDAIMHAVRIGAESFTLGSEAEQEGYLACEASPTRRATRSLKMQRDTVQNRVLGEGQGAAFVATDMRSTVRAILIADALPAGCAVRDATTMQWLTPEGFMKEVVRGNDRPGNRVCDSGTTAARCYLVDVGSMISPLAREAMLDHLLGVLRAGDCAVCFGGRNALAALASRTDLDERVIAAHVYGGVPQTVMQPIHREQMGPGVLSMVCDAARAFNFVLVHGKGDESIGASLERGWRFATGGQDGDSVSFASLEAVQDFQARTLDAADLLKPLFEQACLLSNTAAGLLDYGQALHPDDIDVVAVYGYGFPKRARGPMQWSLNIGLPQVVETVTRLLGDGREDMSLAPLLRRAALGIR